MLVLARRKAGRDVVSTNFFFFKTESASIAFFLTVAPFEIYESPKVFLQEFGRLSSQLKFQEG